MDSMEFKGIAWVGNIYQKFEAMCLEVEEAMCQETAKYVENQVQTVGASMKRFCSDVMQDLLPPSSKDLSRVASSDLLLNPYLEFGIHKKPISSIKEDATDSVLFKGISENKSNPNNDVWEDWSAASFDWETSDKDEAHCDGIAMQEPNEAIKRDSRGAQEQKIANTIVDTSFIKSSAKRGKRSRCISSNNIVRAEHTDPCEKSALVSLSQTGVPVSGNTQSGQSVGEEVFRSHTGNSADCDANLEEKKNDTTIQTMVPSGHDSESGFEDTCVIVNGNDYRPTNHKEAIRRSYKKKIQNAFSSKKKSARKHEYKQLAARYGNIDAQPNLQGEDAIALASTLPKNTKSKKLPTHDSIESEWELL